MISKNEIKFLKSLNSLKFRDKHNMFKVEGWRSLKEFLNSDYKLISLFATSNWLEANDISIKNIKTIPLRDLKTISSLKTPNQIIGIFEQKRFQLDVNSFKIDIGVFLEDVTNPGNLGSIIRTCDWFGIKKIICSTESVDIYNPKVVQSSMGSLSRLSIKYVNRDFFLSEIKEKNILSFVADLKGENIFTQKKISNGVIFFGNESRGVSNKIKELATKRVTIPNKGNSCESLNLSVSFGIIMSQLLISK
jgi:TrmH family RNA methyltransferase